MKKLKKILERLEKYPNKSWMLDGLTRQRLSNLESEMVSLSGQINKIVYLNQYES